MDVQCFLTNMERDFPAFNRVYAEEMAGVEATRTTMCVARKRDVSGSFGWGCGKGREARAGEAGLEATGSGCVGAEGEDKGFKRIRTAWLHESLRRSY